MIARLSMVLTVVACGGAAFAGGGPATDAYDDISQGAPVDFHLLLDLYLLHNFNAPASGRNQLRELDFNADLPSLSYLRLTLARRPRHFGFRLDVGVGNTAEAYRAADPLQPSHPSLARGLSFVEQAFVTVVVPAGRGIQIDVGKFSTPVGLEDNESVTNWNYSRSFLYSWAEPSLHVGVRASYQASDRLSLSLFWLNGWNSNVVGGDSMRSFAGAVSHRPNERWALVLVYLGGLERPPTQLDGKLSFRNVLSGSMTYMPVKPVTFSLAVDYGNDCALGGVNWWGVAGYARLQARSWLAATVRGEYFADPDGFTTGTRQQLAEATATLEAEHSAGRARLLARLEYRHDQSNRRPFEGAQPDSRSIQDTITLALAATF
jgi:Putative beta-barrel porin-2, OmpL-like. bbp2